jgi:hypothetical protein
MSITRALLAEQAAGGGADPSGPAGDDRNFVLEPPGHGASLSLRAKRSNSDLLYRFWIASSLRSSQ